MFINIIRACVTSILRTYHTAKIFNLQDISFNNAKMGLWTYAEITIGILVSCAPVLPRFFRHCGPRVYQKVSFRRSNHRRLFSNSPFSGSKGRPNEPPPNSVTARADGVCGLAPPPVAKLNGDDHKSALSDMTVPLDCSIQTVGGWPTTRGDLETY